MQQNTRFKAAAFTLIELLVVVAIIVILIAILVPSLERAMEMANRAKCLANLDATGLGAAQYALENKTFLPDAQPVNPGGGYGIFAIWVNEAVTGWGTHPAYGRYRGHGVLADKGFVSAKSFYCPSNSVADIQYDAQSTPGGPGGWPSDNDPSSEQSNRQYIWTAYHYRATFDGPYPNWRTPRLNLDPGWEPLLADMFADPPNRSVRQHHRIGYNTVLLDGSAHWVHDPDDEAYLWYQGGKSYHAGRYGVIEQVWDNVIARR